MTAGESKSFTIPIYNNSKKQINATGMIARLAICSYVTAGMSPLVLKQCSVVDWDQGMAVLRVDLDPEDTIDLHGKFIYQITAKDVAGDLGVLRGYLYVAPNGDPTAITM